MLEEQTFHEADRLGRLCREVEAIIHRSHCRWSTVIGVRSSLSVGGRSLLSMSDDSASLGLVFEVEDVDALAWGRFYQFNAIGNTSMGADLTMRTIFLPSKKRYAHSRSFKGVNRGSDQSSAHSIECETDDTSHVGESFPQWLATHSLSFTESCAHGNCWRPWSSACYPFEPLTRLEFFEGDSFSSALPVLVHLSSSDGGAVSGTAGCSGSAGEGAGDGDGDGGRAFGRERFLALYEDDCLLESWSLDEHMQPSRYAKQHAGQSDGGMARVRSGFSASNGGSGVMCVVVDLMALTAVKWRPYTDGSRIKLTVRLITVPSTSTGDALSAYFEPAFTNFSGPYIEVLEYALISLLCFFLF